MHNIVSVSRMLVAAELIDNIKIKVYRGGKIC